MSIGKIESVLAQIKAAKSGPATKSAVPRTAPSQRRAAALSDLSQFPTVAIDTNRLEANRVVGFGDFAPNALSAYRMIRTRLLQTMRSNNWRSIAVSSAGAAEGKSLTSINLALSISREGNQNVFLVDLDMRRPTMARYLGVDPPRGVEEYFEGHADAHSVFFRIGAPGIAIATVAETRDSSSELLSSERLPELIKYVFTQDPNAVLLFDMPPLLLSDDVLAVAPYVDAILLVATEGKTKRSDLATAAEVVQKFGLAGVVLNRSAENVAHYY